MCERCAGIKKEAQAEIRDLLNYHRPVNGPLSTQMKERVASVWDEMVETQGGEEEALNLVDSVRMYLIAQRAAYVARACVGTMHHGLMPSEILHHWTTENKREEMELLVENLLTRGGIFGMMFPVQVDEDEGLTS